MTLARSQLKEFFSSHRNSQILFLRRLLQTATDNPPGDCAPHASMLANMLEELGLSVERHVLPSKLVNENGMTSVTNLVVRHTFGPGPVVALNAHGDVVPPGDGWHYDPYGGAIDDGWMYGRGVAVSKSDIATYTYALLALQQHATDLKGTVELHFTYDEEIGGVLGPQYLLSQGVTRPSYVICPGFSYSIVVAHNGCLHLEVTVTGRSAHAALPDTGRDALEAATAVMARLYSDRTELSKISSKVEGISSPSLVIGRISGGINTNVVPDRIQFRLDRRIVPEEDAGAIEQELRQRIADTVENFEGISVSCKRLLLAAPFKPVAGTDRLAAAVAEAAAEVLERDIPQHGVPLYADARHYAAAGIPTIMYGAGPETLEEANGHRADERIRVTELGLATEVIALAVANLLS